MGNRLLISMVVILCCIGTLVSAAEASSPMFPEQSSLPAPKQFVTLATEWPADLPLPPGTSKGAARQTPSLFTADIKTSQKIDVVFTAFEKALTDAGWTLDQRHLEGNACFFIQAKKGSRTLNLVGADAFIAPAILDVRIVDESAVLPISESEASRKEARALLDEMNDAYRNLRSYGDKGTLYSEYLQDDGSMDIDTTEFATAYIRPIRFRLEYVEDDERTILFQDDMTVEVYEGSVETYDTLNEALHVNAGLITSSAPQLLLGEETDTLKDLRTLQLVGHENLNGTECQVLEGYDKECSSRRAWIGPDKLLRRLEMFTPLYGGVSHETIDYAPEANPELPSSKLEFNRAGQLPLTSGGASDIFWRALYGIVSYFW